MDFLNRKTFFTSLRATYPNPTDGYFWDALNILVPFSMPARVSLRRLEEATLDLDKFLEIRNAVFLFADHISGWAGLGERRRHSPLKVDDLKAALYYICNSSFEWFAVFCHENDWHLFIAPRLCRSRMFESWATKHGVRFDRNGDGSDSR